MAEHVLIRYGHFEVDPQKMSRKLFQEQLSEDERERIISMRTRYLEWMHRHFADGVLPPD